MGSVKDIEILEEPTEDSTDHAIFHFSDRYSVFDWGEMPEHIHGKGEALALMGAYSFEILEGKGVETHYLGMGENGEIKKLDDLRGPSNDMHIEFVNVLKPEFKDGEYDYSVFQDPAEKNYLIPLEIIYRNRIPVGSSARRRYSPRELGLDMEDWPEEPVSLSDPFLESSTKLEEQDRYLDDGEAEAIAGIPIGEIYEEARMVNRVITRRAEEVGMRHDDGKAEFLYIDGDLVVGDVVGTFDEDRFTFQGMQVSKEVLRQAYKAEQPEWVEEVKRAKREAREKGVKDWKGLVDSEPRRLGLEDLVSEMYRAGANRYIGREFFDVRELEGVMRDLRAEL